MPTTSGVDRLVIRGRDFYIKRDDLIDPLLSGNKYRKLYSLVDTPATRYRRLISYGGTQSNAMFSIAALCRQKGWLFDYTAKTVPAHLKASPSGNLRMALALGMRLHEVAPAAYQAAIEKLKLQSAPAMLLVPQGGADPMARFGIDMLAREIDAWRQNHRISRLHIVTPSGTGTMAYYLACALPELIVLTTPVVGDRGYLAAQMERLGAMPHNLHILESSRKHHFARPSPEFLHMWRELKEAGIEFDLIYGAAMWHVLFEQADRIDGTILYVHSGGLSGNATMLERYRHKGLI